MYNSFSGCVVKGMGRCRCVRVKRGSQVCYKAFIVYVDVSAERRHLAPCIQWGQDHDIYIGLKRGLGCGVKMGVRVERRASLYRRR